MPENATASTSLTAATAAMRETETRTPPSEPMPMEIAFRAAFGYIAPSCLNALLRLEIPDLLAAGPAPVAELARKASVHEDTLYRVLRALASIGVFTETAHRTFANTPASELLTRDHPQSVRPMVQWLTDAFHFDVFRDMLPTIQDGKPAVEKIYNKSAFEVIFSDPREAEVFHNAMTGFSSVVMPAILKAYDFAGIGTLADIAGGHGFVLTSILNRYPGMKGILYELENVIQGARERVEQLGLADRVSLVAGNFFEDVPAADGYIMKHIIHDWDNERALVILRNCARHLQPGGKVLLLEAVVPPLNQPHPVKWLDMEMLMLPGGKERTEAEYRDLFAWAGMQLNRVIPTESPLCVLEAVKI